MRLSLPLTCLALGNAALSQSFVPTPQGLTEVVSDRFPGAKIRYKEVNGLCETTEGVKSYSGYVELPKDFIPDAASWPDDSASNFYFWYFEARNDPESAPTAIYLGGGPGYTTFDGSAVFPCYFNSDANTTTLNEHSWNTGTNMLYIDQPVGTGFSYRDLQNGTYNFLNTTDFNAVEDEEDLPELSPVLRQATLSGYLDQPLTNTSMGSARSLWRFSQVFFTDFPEWQTENEDIAVWAVSYGGLMGTLFASYTVDQNALIDDGSHELDNATILNIATVGVINGIVDLRAMALGLPDFARNNTYGVQIMSEETAMEAVGAVLAEDWGCYAQADRCRAAVAENDPESIGADKEVNGICANATVTCNALTTALLEDSPYEQFDITLMKPAAYPLEHNTAFFNQPWVQAELGVPLNFTRQKESVGMYWLAKTGDAVRYDTSYLSNLLDNGVNVAMVYGDLDYRCNWYAGENTSLQIEFEDKSSFAEAGYAYIVTDGSDEAGLVRESGGLSFSRVFGAGHSAGGYQPEAVAAIFNRAMSGRDVATGDIELSSREAYSTEGEMNPRDVKPKKPETRDNVCYVHNAPQRCTEEQLFALGNGTAEIKDYVVVDPKGLSANSSEGGNSGGSSGGEQGGEEESDDEGDNGGTGTVEEDRSSRTTTAVGMTFVAAAVAFFAAL